MSDKKLAKWINTGDYFWQGQSEYACSNCGYHTHSEESSHLVGADPSGETGGYWSVDDEYPVLTPYCPCCGSAMTDEDGNQIYVNWQWLSGKPYFSSKKTKDGRVLELVKESEYNSAHKCEWVKP